VDIRAVRCDIGLAICCDVHDDQTSCTASRCARDSWKPRIKIANLLPRKIVSPQLRIIYKAEDHMIRLITSAKESAPNSTPMNFSCISLPAAASYICARRPTCCNLEAPGCAWLRLSGLMPLLLSLLSLHAHTQPTVTTKTYFRFMIFMIKSTRYPPCYEKPDE
jgi:hypothetical protein